MSKLRKIIYRVKARLFAQTTTAANLIDVCIRAQDGNVLKLRFYKEASVEILRESLSKMLKNDPDNLLIYSGNTLLVGEQIIKDSITDSNECLELAFIDSFNQIENFHWCGEGFNVFPGQPCSDSAVVQANWFYEQNELDSYNRIDQLTSLLSNMDDAGAPVVIMAFSSNFSSMFINWVRSCDTHNISVRGRAIIFPMDEKSRGLAENEGFKVCYDNTSSVLSDIGHSQQYGDVEFKKHMFFQNAIIKDMLELGCDFLFQDVDLVWLENPFEYFSGRNDNDIEFMFDGGTTRHGPLCANTGFIYFHANTSTINFWDIIYRNYDRVIQFSSQQQPLNKYLGILHTRGLKVKILPEELFANGHLFNPDVKKSRLPERPKVIHCSWTRDMEQKILKYKNNKLWFILDNV